MAAVVVARLPRLVQLVDMAVRSDTCALVRDELGIACEHRTLVTDDGYEVALVHFLREEEEKQQ